MNKNDMNQIKQEYKNNTMSPQDVTSLKNTIAKAKKEEKKGIMGKILLPFAAALALFIAIPNISMQAAQVMGSLPVLGKLVQIVTFREFEVQTEKQQAEVEIAQIQITEEKVDQESAQEETPAPEQIKAAESAAEINDEIQTLCEKYITEFKENMESDGYQALDISHEIVNSNDQYFTLKIICIYSAADSAEWNYYYTIDLTTGERLALADLFADGSDYITPISENIKEQMTEQMAADENKIYWLNDPDFPEMNFSSITEETEFYLNENAALVISFQEGDVAPMYMGVCTFEIPEEIIAEIRK